MISKYKPISISLSPNVEKDDVRLALHLILRPWKWRNPPSHKASARQGGNAAQNFEKNFTQYLGVKYAVSFNSGRSSLYAILKALNLEKGSDVALQAFTCNAVPNPILWAELNPVYIDCANDFNINTQDLDRLIRTNKPMVMIVQHTFGLPANIDEIMKFARENNIIVIEDCAHALGAECGGGPLSPRLQRGKVGTFGKAAFFSFSRDKVISQ